MNTTELDAFIELVSKLDESDWQKLLNFVKDH